jgi:hypothetical protein
MTNRLMLTAEFLGYTDEALLEMERALLHEIKTQVDHAEALRELGVLCHVLVHRGLLH